MSERVLVIVAHPDDEVLGCGGTIALHIERGDEVCVLIMADGCTSREDAASVAEKERMAHEACGILGVKDLTLLAYPDNRMDSIDRLDVVKDIERKIARVRPTTVYTHHGSDANIDHRIVNDAVIVATRPQPGQTVKRLLFCEVPSSTEYQPPGRQPFQPNVFVNICAAMKKKQVALAVYQTEMRDFPHARSPLATEALAMWRGASVGIGYAEAFVLGREIC